MSVFMFTHNFCYFCFMLRVNPNADQASDDEELNKDGMG